MHGTDRGRVGRGQGRRPGLGEGAAVNKNRRNILIAVVVLIALVLMAFWPRGGGADGVSGSTTAAAWSQNQAL